MTGAASDPPDWQPHIRNKPRREALAKRFRDPGDPLRVVLVRDMWLTGFDAPSLHTMYVDKPMRGHGLMQAIARVNRVFRDKPGGLVVDYLGLAHELKAALATYTESGGTGRDGARPGRGCCGDAGEVRDLLRLVPRLRPGRVDRRHAGGTARTCCPPAQEHVLAQENGKERCVKAVRELSQAFALAVPHEEALRVSATTWRSFRPSGRHWRSAPNPTRGPRKSSIMPFDRSSPAPWRRTLNPTISAAPAANSASGTMRAKRGAYGMQTASRYHRLLPDVSPRQYSSSDIRAALSSSQPTFCIDCMIRKSPMNIDNARTPTAAPVPWKDMLAIVTALSPSQNGRA